jgi:hypothetical protein
MDRKNRTSARCPVTPNNVRKFPSRDRRGIPQQSVPLGRTFQKISTRETPVKEVGFVHLQDGSLVDLIEAPGSPAGLMLAHWKNGEVRYLLDLEADGALLRPLGREDNVLRHLRLPTGVERYESPAVLMKKVAALIARCVDVNENISTVLACFVLCSWLVDRLPAAPYVSIVGLPQSGKTTLLRVLALLCRRSLLTGDISSAAFYRVCEEFSPTLLLDEGGTATDRRSLLQLLRMGSTPDTVVMRKEQSWRVYGAKVFSTPEPFDDAALNTRCIQVQMKETARTDLLRPSDPAVIAETAQLQRQLLQFRFDNYHSLTVRKISDRRLSPRTRDLISCLLAPLDIWPEFEAWLLEHFVCESLLNKEPLPPHENAVLVALFVAVHQHINGGAISVKDMTKYVNMGLAASGERHRLKPRQVGAILTKFGITHRCRSNGGWIVLLFQEDYKLIHRLAERHGLDHRDPLCTTRRNCILCTNAGAATA